MNSRTLIAFLAVSSFSGCIVVDRSGGGGGVQKPVPGDVSFSWSFAGATCSAVPQVQSINLSIPGQQLQNSGVFPCLANDYPGITLLDFAGGDYSFAIEAVGYGGEVLFGASGTFRVNGNIQVTTDLAPIVGANSYAYLTWRFPRNSVSNSPTCEQAGASAVQVSIDGANPVEYPCADGFTTSGAQTQLISAGTHSIELLGVNAGGYPYYRYQGTLTTTAGAPVAFEYQLGWNVGGAAVGWSFTDNAYTYTCSTAGITTVTLNFEDSAGNLVYGNEGDAQACGASPAVYSYLLPGTYRVYAKAYGTGNTVYLSNGATPPTVTVAAGVFVTTADAIPLTLFRQ
jgi:hypothetical protein